MRTLFPVLFFLFIAVFVVMGVQNVFTSSGAEQLRVMEQAIRRSAVQCYAIEGRYPENLTYLEENYGLLLNKDRFIYHYQRIGSNIVPEIWVFEK